MSDTSITKIDGKISLAEAQEIVGGYVAIVQLTHNKVMVVNEEAVPLQLPLNRVASLLAGQPIYGNVVIAKGVK